VAGECLLNGMLLGCWSPQRERYQLRLGGALSVVPKTGDRPHLTLEVATNLCLTSKTRKLLDYVFWSTFIGGHTSKPVATFRKTRLFQVLYMNDLIGGHQIPGA
jgi:hypothetical protein